MAGINRTTGKATDLITFSRASGGTALRKISYGSELVTNGGFDSASGWTLGAGWTISGGELVATSATGVASQVISLTGGKVYRITADNTANIQIRIVGGSGQSLGYFSGADVDKIFVFTAGAGSLLEFVANGTTTGTIDNISVKEVLFDQPDGTLTLFNHPTNIPRIEYDADGTVKGLLIEEARTNLVTYSEAFDNAAWGKSAVTVTTNAALAPDGTATADKLVNTATSGFHNAAQTVSISAGTFTATVFIKSAELTLGAIQFFSGVPSVNSIVRFDLATETAVVFSSNGITSVTSALVAVGGGWFRCSVTFTIASAASSFQFRLLPNDGSFYTGDGLSGLYFWGAQLEAGSFATSYIPTSGATATRAADIASISVDSFGYRQDAGTVVVEAQLLYNPNSIQVPVFLGDNPSATINNSQLFFGDGTYRVRDSSGTTLAEIDAGSFSASSFVKAVFTYNLNDFAASINGGAVVSDTSGDPSNVSSATLSLSANPVGTILGHHIKSVSYYPRRLSNAQLVQLTA